MAKFDYSAATIDYQGFGIQTYTFGTGDKVVFSFPSFPNSGLEYVFFARHYDSTKYKFITFDLPGWAGDSENIFGQAAFGIQIYADIAEAVLKYYQVSKFRLIGYSFGGAIASILALRRPADVERFALVSPVIFGHLLKGTFKQRVVSALIFLKQEWLLKQFITRIAVSIVSSGMQDISPAEIEKFCDSLSKMDAHVLAACAQYVFTNDAVSSQDFAKLDNLLLVSSRDERMMFRKQAEYIRRLLDSEKSLYLHGTHDDFILRPQAKVVNTVMSYLLS